MMSIIHHFEHVRARNPCHNHLLDKLGSSNSPQPPTLHDINKGQGPVVIDYLFSTPVS